MFGPLLADYQRLVGRRGIPPEDAAYGLPRRGTVAAAMLLHAGLADAAICGGSGQLVAPDALPAADHSAPAGRRAASTASAA